MNTGMKVFLIGIDGAAFKVINPLMAEGKLPALKRLVDEGVHGNLKSTIPPLTPCAWTSLMTGKNPGKHGVYDFYHLDEEYNLRLNHYSKASGDKIWDILSREGKKSCVVNVPFTYPPSPINGIMVSGFTAPGLESQFTHPPELKDELLTEIPDFKLIEQSRYSDDDGEKDRFLKDLKSFVKTQYNAVKYLYDKDDWDFFMLNFLSADHAQHWFWRHMDSRMDETFIKDETRYATAVEEVYVEIDKCVSGILDCVGDETVVMVVSDHGFGPIKKNIVVNNWLRKKGYLSLKTRDASFLKKTLNRLGLTPKKIIDLGIKHKLGRFRGKKYFKFMNKFFSSISFSFKDIDWSKTRAYAFGTYGGLFINLKGRQQKGKIKKKTGYEETVNEIINDLRELRDPEDGEKIATTIWRKTQLYSGKHEDKMPDIIFSLKDFSYINSSMFAFVSNEIFTSSHTLSSGYHRLEGVFIVKGRGIREKQKIFDAEITDIAPTVLRILGSRSPKDMDGRVLHEIFQ